MYVARNRITFEWIVGGAEGENIVYHVRYRRMKMRANVLRELAEALLLSGYQIIVSLEPFTDR